MPKTHADRAPSYPIGVLPVVEPVVESPSPPPATAGKAEWVAYAQALGVDVKGKTKAQIRKAVA